MSAINNNPESTTARRVARAYGETGSRDADWQALAEKHLPAVKHEVMRFAMRLPSHVEVEDLYGVAVSALMRVLPRCLESNERSFRAYLRQRIRGALVDELRRMDCISRTARGKARRYDEALRTIEQREGRPAREEEIRREMGLDRKSFESLLEEIRPISFFSLHESASGNEESQPLLESIEDEANVPVTESMERDELTAFLRDRIERLPEMQRKVLMMYYYEEMRLAEIAQVFGLSESRICQVHTQAVRGLRVLIRSRMES